MRKLCFCSDTQPTLIRFESFADDALVPTNVGSKRADALIESVKASLTAVGHLNSLGQIVYTARHGGTCGNRVFVEQTPGEVGPGHSSRTLAATVDLHDEDGISIVVTFGTNNDGVLIRPTAQQVADLVNTTAVIKDLVSASPGGTGGVGTLSPTYLVGGLDTGDWRKFNVKRGDCLRINSIEVS